MKGHVLSYLTQTRVINGDCFFKGFSSFFTSYGRLSYKLYNIRLPVLINTILNIMDSVRNVKVSIFKFSVSLVRRMYPYIDRFLVYVLYRKLI